jgi:hypothetical protein
MSSVLYLVVHALVRLVVGAGQLGRDKHAKDLEILALRHQLRVLQRTSGPLKLRAIDRVLLAAASRSCRVTAGSPSSSRRRRCCAGIGNS